MGLYSLQESQGAWDQPAFGSNMFSLNICIDSVFAGKHSIPEISIIA
jgi:hypothetical protein